MTAVNRVNVGTATGALTTYDLQTVVCSSRVTLGECAGHHAAEVLRRVLAEKGAARLMLAAARSQEDTLRTLAAEPDIAWRRVTCFHMDEYIGLAPHAPQGFANWLERTFFEHLPQAPVFHRIPVANAATEAAVQYEQIMGNEPFDLVLLGIGVNGHLAFNDPPAALRDRAAARIVQIDAVSRKQQVDEGHFRALAEVPRMAVTVTIPRLLHAREVIASVPGAEKRQAVAAALEMPVSGSHPATALRTHPKTTLYVDDESAPTVAARSSEP